MKYTHNMTVEQKLYLTIDKISKLKCSSMFVQPIDISLYPDYHSKINQPMDFQTIKYKIKHGKYRYAIDIYDDLKLIAKNCFTYNKNQSNFHQLNKIITKFINSINITWQNIQNQLISSNTDQYYIMSKEPQSTNQINDIESKIIIAHGKKIQRMVGQGIEIKESKNWGRNDGEVLDKEKIDCHQIKYKQWKKNQLINGKQLRKTNNTKEKNKNKNKLNAQQISKSTPDKAHHSQKKIQIQKQPNQSPKKLRNSNCSPPDYPSKLSKQSSELEQQASHESQTSVSQSSQQQQSSQNQYNDDDDDQSNTQTLSQNTSNTQTLSHNANNSSETNQNLPSKLIQHENSNNLPNQQQQQLNSTITHHIDNKNNTDNFEKFHINCDTTSYQKYQSNNAIINKNISPPKTITENPSNCIQNYHPKPLSSLSQFHKFEYNIIIQNQTKQQNKQISYHHEQQEQKLLADEQQISHHLIEHKLRKYKTAIKKYLMQIQSNIFGIFNIETRQQYHPFISHQISSYQINTTNPNNNIQPHDSLNNDQPTKFSKQHPRMQSLTYLTNSLTEQLVFLGEGQININKLIKFISELRIWMQSLGILHLEQKNIEQFCKIQTAVIKCLYKIVEYSQLTTNEVIDGHEKINELSCIKQSQSRTTQPKDKNTIPHSYTNPESKPSFSKILHLQTKTKINNLLTLPTASQLQKISQSNISITNKLDTNQKQLLVEHAEFIQLIQQDRIYQKCTQGNVNTHINEEKQKKQTRKINKNKNKTKSRHHKTKYQQPDEYYPPTKYISHKKFSPPRQQSPLSSQYHQQKSQQIKQNDQNFLSTYALRSNTMIIYKYQSQIDKLLIDWDRITKNMLQCLPQNIDLHQQ